MNGEIIIMTEGDVPPDSHRISRPGVGSDAVTDEVVDSVVKV